MKKAKLLILIFALIGMLIILIPNACLAAETAKVKVIEGEHKDTEYDDIQAALTAQTNNNDIELQLQGDITNGKGFVVPENKTVTIDFNGYTYNVTSDLVGSAGYETNACQLLQGATVTLKNGTLESGKADILIQNYSNLTIENMTLNHTKSEGGAGYPIALSVNNGKVEVEGETSILSNNIALDVYYWKERYEAGTDVTVNTLGTVSGDILVRSSDESVDNPANKLTIENINHVNGNFTVSEKSKNNVTINGGTFIEDVSDFTKDEYTCVSENDRYVVGLKATSLSIVENLELEVGNTASLNATVIPQNTVETINYQSTSDAIASVTEDGTVTAIAEGSTTITATIGDLIQTCNVTVTAKSEINPDEQLDTNVPAIDKNNDSTLAFGVADENKETINQILKSTLMDENFSLHSQIQNLLESGATVTSEIDLKPLLKEEVSQEILDAMLDAAGLDEVVQYIDIGINVIANGANIGNITNLNGKIPLSVSVPNDLLGENRKFYILKYHDGVVEKLDLTLEGNQGTFYTDEFSVYALAYEDTEAEITNTTETPKTGDTLANMFAILVILTAVSLIIIRITKKNRLMK